MAWQEPRSNYTIADEVTPEIFNQLAENEKYLKQTQDTKITSDDVKNATITNTQYSSRTNLTANEVLHTGFAKIRKWFADLKALAFKATVGNADITDVAASKVTGLHSVATSGNYSELNGKPTLGALAAKDTVANPDITGVAGSKVSGTVANATQSTNATRAANLQSPYSAANYTPGNYQSSYSALCRIENKPNSTIALNTVSGYSLVITIVPANTSYGSVVQIAQNSSGVYKRYGVSTSTWSAWSKLVTADELGELNGIATLDGEGYVEQTARNSLNASTAASCTGNSATATKLRTASTIGLSGVTATAQSFSGASSITIPISAIPASLLTGTIAVARIPTNIPASSITVTADAKLGNATTLQGVLNYISGVFAGTNTTTKVQTKSVNIIV